MPTPSVGRKIAPTHPLLVHPGQGCVAFAILWWARFELAEQIIRGGGARVSAAEVLVQRTGCSNWVERRVRDEAVDLTADEQPGLALDLGPLHRPLLVPLLEVTRERVERLVVVVVAVEELEPESCHDPPRTPARRRSALLSSDTRTKFLIPQVPFGAGSFACMCGCRSGAARTGTSGET